mmetsp:Transcript_28527/g.62241  ORF Transcript_28527/g.62241 Transcript_28527/m.62241 type:complete len:296 (-) Transcript_28527:2127-3014(-)
MTTIIAHHAVALNLAHSQLLQALLHVHVLAPTVPVKLLLAALLPIEVGLDGWPGEDLECPVHRFEAVGVAVQEEQLGPWLLGVSLHHVPEPLAEKHGVWIDLDNPVVVLEPSVLEDEVPRAHEYQGVQPRVGGDVLPIIFPHLDLWGRDFECLPTAAEVDDASVAEDSGLIATKDARFVGQLGPQHVRLVARRPRHREAEERRVRPLVPEACGSGGRPRGGGGGGRRAGGRRGRGRGRRLIDLTGANLSAATDHAHALVGIASREPKLSIQEIATFWTRRGVPHIELHFGVEVAQ